jgi:hypothetical protein
MIGNYNKERKVLQIKCIRKEKGGGNDIKKNDRFRVGAPSRAHMCKSVILENTRCTHGDISDPLYSRYYCVITQVLLNKHLFYMEKDRVLIDTYKSSILHLSTPKNY